MIVCPMAAVQPWLMTTTAEASAIVRPKLACWKGLLSCDSHGSLNNLAKACPTVMPLIRWAGQEGRAFLSGTSVLTRGASERFAHFFWYSGNSEVFYSEMAPDPESTDTFILGLPLSNMIRGDFRTTSIKTGAIGTLLLHCDVVWMLFLFIPFMKQGILHLRLSNLELLIHLSPPVV